MALYTFYPTRQNGLSPSFVSLCLATDGEAVAHASVVLADHDSADRVVVCVGNQVIHTLARPSL